MPYSFFSWRFRQAFITSTISFIVGFLVAWLICSDTFAYMYHLLFSS